MVPQDQCLFSPKAPFQHLVSSMTGGSQVDPVISRMAAEDKVPWYRKRNLRGLYILMFPTCIGIEMTSGCGQLRRLPSRRTESLNRYDSSMMNGLQAVNSWNSCKCTTFLIALFPVVIDALVQIFTTQILRFWALCRLCTLLAQSRRCHLSHSLLTGSAVVCQL